MQEMSSGGRASGDEERVLQLITRVVNGGRFELVETLVHPDYFDHEAPPSRSSGLTGFKATVLARHEAFAGFRLEPKDVIASEGKVVVRATAAGRHVGDLNGMPATGREWSTAEIHIFRLSEGRVIEHWATRDQLGALQQ